MDTIKKNTETLIESSEGVGLEINVEKTKYMLLSRHQTVGRNRDIKIANRLFENVSQFKYLGTTVTNQHLIQKEIKRRFNSGNACYHSVQNLLSSCLLSKKLKNYKRQYVYLSNIYLRSQLRIYWCYFYSLCSQHVSAPIGHLQVKYNYITYIS
jgi:hypothetical protein